MVTRLHGVLKRELRIGGRPYVVTLDEEGIKLTVKGRRNGQHIVWKDFTSGDAALALALNASLAGANDGQRPAARKPQKPQKPQKPRKPTSRS